MNRPPERRSAPGHVWGEGLLAHHFHAPYWASLAIVFDDAASARDAVRTLGAPWKQSERDPKVIACSVNSEALDALKASLASFGADPDKIDSVRYSVDSGEWFGVLVPVTPAEQAGLFG